MHLKFSIFLLPLAMMGLWMVGPGHGAEPWAMVPKVHSLGSVWVGAEVRRTLTLRNPHSLTVEIRSIEVSDSSVNIVSHPREIEPGGTGSVEVRWAPRDRGELSVIITVETEGGLSLSPQKFRMRGKARGSNAEAHTPTREPAIPAFFITRILRKADPALLLSTASLQRELSHNG